MKKLFATLLVVVAVVAAGCSGGSERASDAPEGSPTPVPVKESFDNELPASFPDDFPLPEDREIVYSIRSDKTVVFFKSAASREDLRAFMLEKLPEAGWPISFCGELSDPVNATFVTAAKGDRSAQVIVGFVAAPKEQVTDYQFIVEIAEGPVASARTDQLQECAS